MPDFDLGISTPSGTVFDIAYGDLGGGAPDAIIPAGEPIFPTRTLLILGGLAVAAVALVILLK